jgi:hypothetical protein
MPAASMVLFIDTILEGELVAAEKPGQDRM